jgi:preprotein translocase subunit SecG
MERVTLHSSWRGIATTVGGGSTLLALGALGFVAGGVNVVPIVLVIAGVVFVLITLFDYPIRSTFTADGVERKAVLRRQRFAWAAAGRGWPDGLRRATPLPACRSTGVGRRVRCRRRRRRRGDRSAADARHDVPTPGRDQPDLVVPPVAVGSGLDEAPVGSSAVRDVILYITLVINIASMIGLIAGILMHSGRGGGLSDMFGGGGGAALGSTAAERNLNRITFVLALIWVFSVVALSFLFERF